MNYSYAQSAMQRWTKQNARAAQLFESAPTLFWLLVGRQQMVGWPDAHVERLLLAPRTQMLSAICGVGQRAALRWLTRVKLERGDQSEFATLVDGVRAELHRSRWGKEPVIPIHWVSGALHELQLQQSPAYHHFCKECREHPVQSAEFLQLVREYGRFWNDALSVARALKIPDAEVALKRCRDFSAIRRLHDRWTARLNQRYALLEVGATAFPEAPIAGTSEIHPIPTLEDLRAEGRLMHHCVAVYEEAILRGECYIYRVLAPERATLELRLNRGAVLLGQASLAYNRAPSAETLAKIQCWLEKVAASD